MWKALPADQRKGIKDYIVAVLIETSSTEQSLEKNKTYLSKLNIVLVQVSMCHLTHALDFEA
jgi:exportin-1